MHGGAHGVERPVRSLVRPLVAGVEHSLISLNAGGELLVELLKRVEEEKLSFKAINKTLSLEEVSENHWKMHYRYKRQDITLEKSDT